MNEEQRSDFLHAWCQNLSDAVNSLAHRLLAVEEALKNPKKKP